MIRFDGLRRGVENKHARNGYIEKLAKDRYTTLTRVTHLVIGLHGTWWRKEIIMIMHQATVSYNMVLWQFNMYGAIHM